MAHKPSITQDALAGRLAARGVHVDRSAVARIEMGKRYVLDYEVLALASALRVPVEQLFNKKYRASHF